MNAIDMLEIEHKGAKKVMGEIAASAGAKREALFKTLKGELEGHDHIEETIFYPGVLAHPNTAGLSAGDKAAHEAAEAILAKIAKLPVDDATWMTSFNDLKTKLFAHIADEETNLFVKIRKALSPAELEALGQKMADAKKVVVKIGD